MTKTQIIETVSKMPDEISIDEVIERLVILEKIEKGQNDVKEGRTFTEAEARDRLQKWLK